MHDNIMSASYIDGLFGLTLELNLFCCNFAGNICSDQISIFIFQLQKAAKQSQIATTLFYNYFQLILLFPNHY